MTHRQISSLTVVLLGVLAAPPALAGPGQVVAPPAAASADAYGLLVDVRLLPSLTELRHGPVSRAAQEFPSTATEADETAVLRSGPHPSDGSVVRTAGVMTASAEAGAAPRSVAVAQVNDVALLGATNSLVTADTVRARASSGCADDPDATGTVFENLRVNGQPVDRTPAPNTTYDLGVATVILNEQRPAVDGRGLVVNAIHVTSTATGDALFRGDVVVAHAMTTVNCPNGAGATEESDLLAFELSVDPEVAAPGDEVTYTAAVTNESDSPVLVNEFVDHLPPEFEYVSTSGDFGDTPDRTELRPNGGAEVVVGNGTTIPAGETFEQRFVARVTDGAEPAAYFNNVELFAAGAGNYVTGLDTPVQAVAERAVAGGDLDAGAAGDERADRAESRLPSTGGTDVLYLLCGAALVALSRLTYRLRNEPS